MQRQPENLAAHEFFTNNGWQYTFCPNDFEDDGDAESGPHLTGNPDADLYEHPDGECVAIDWRGAVKFIQQPDPPEYIFG